jgi:LAO/AO transport system kinase
MSQTSHRIGITGPPGAGKSTLVSKLASFARREGKSVGIVCADPSSPFSGGAVLGDRIRMQQHYLDNGVYIRSMSTRGSLGGLPATAGAVISLLAASGKDVIFVETVGVGQTELDVIEDVDTVIVVLVPEAGDSVQAMKAGLMEIADVFVVNKADRPGADSLVVEIESMLDLNTNGSSWRSPVIATQAENDIGTGALYEQIWLHRSASIENGQIEQRKARQRRNQFVALLHRMISARLEHAPLSDRLLSKYLSSLDRGEISPYTAAEEVYATLFGQSGRSRKPPI